MRCLVIFLRFLGVILSPIVLVLSLIVPAFSYIILGDKNNVARMILLTNSMVNLVNYETEA